MITFQGKSYRAAKVAGLALLLSVFAACSDNGSSDEEKSPPEQASADAVPCVPQNQEPMKEDEALKGGNPDWDMFAPGWVDQSNTNQPGDEKAAAALAEQKPCGG